MPSPEIYHYIKNRNFMKKYEEQYKKEETYFKFLKNHINKLI
jgi:hypothetical protein